MTEPLFNIARFLMHEILHSQPPSVSKLYPFVFVPDVGLHYPKCLSHKFIHLGLIHWYYNHVKYIFHAEIGDHSINLYFSFCLDQNAIFFSFCHFSTVLKTILMCVKGNRILVDANHMLIVNCFKCLRF